MKNYETAIAEILEVDNVGMNDELSSFECWDSLTILSIMAFVSENFNVELLEAEINKAKTVGGLKELIKAKSNGAIL